MKALEVNNVSKLYRIGNTSSLDADEKNKLIRLLKRPLNNYRKYRSLYKFTDEELNAPEPGPDLLWALRDITFEANQGEVIGLVGANGAGKSTLLKVISRITPPTRGHIIHRGRLSCLIEVGTGFHPELTGRENVYMKSTVMGMRKREVDAKFDEIVEFSGVGKFIDTPAKRYSSGMTVRLAFAVMAHLEPEILIVDEVLAVGDAAFQRKCLNKMSSVSKSGHTVLFVSHNMAAVTRLCDRGLLIKNGELVQDGSAADVVHAHVTGGGEEDLSGREWNEDEAPGDECCRLRSIRMVSKRGPISGSIGIEESFGIQLTFDVLEEGQVLNPSFTIVSEGGIDLFSSLDKDERWEHEPRKPGRYIMTAWVPGGLLAEGAHFVRAVMRSVKRQYRPFTERDVIAFNVVDESAISIGSSWWEGKPGGVFRPNLDWTTEYVQPDMIIEG